MTKRGDFDEERGFLRREGILTKRRDFDKERGFLRREGILTKRGDFYEERRDHHCFNLGGFLYSVNVL